MSHHNQNSQKPSHFQKRRSEQNFRQEPPAKKARLQNGNSHEAVISNITVLPTQTPVLPAISAKYEKVVFTHPSVAPHSASNLEPANYDRLEFLGDAYIEIIATRLIYERYKTMNAGGMARVRESIVKNDTLSKYAILYGFDKRLQTNDIPREGQKGWVKIHGDVFEAYAAAVVLSNPSGGEAQLESWLKDLWAPIFDATGTPAVRTEAKQDLAKMIKYKDVLINYIEERPPKIHKGIGRETYFVGVYLDGWGYHNQHLGSGEGPSKVVAGQEAAQNAIDNHPLIDEIVAKRNAFLAQKQLAEDRSKAEETRA